VTPDHVLIVEDERAQREALSRFLSKRDMVVETVGDGEAALKRLRESAFDAVLTDLRLPGMDGLEVVRSACDLSEDLSVLLMTAYASVDSAIEALRLGADDYLLKPLILEDVFRKLTAVLARKRVIQENAELRRTLRHYERDTGIVACSEAMVPVMAWVDKAATSRSNVLVRGETGTGKDVIARAIHRRGPNSEDAFLPINVAAVPENMVESELFGHERGAFTGAERRREGVIRAAGNGTVFLDEVAELPLRLQPKLLRALEAREVRPVGNDRAIPFGARIIAATNRDLSDMVKEGSFREDLYYRLNVLCVDLPPLRDRREDIGPLIKHILSRQQFRNLASAGRCQVERQCKSIADECKEHERCGMIPKVTTEAMRLLCSYSWRGNIRELSNVLERMLILSDGETISIDELPEDIRQESSTESHPLADAISAFEGSHFATVLRLCDNNREKAAAELGVSPATLYRRLEKLGLKRNSQ